MKINWKNIAICAAILLGLAYAGYRIWDYFHQSNVNKQQGTLQQAVKNNFEVKPVAVTKDHTGAEHKKYDPSANTFTAQDIKLRKDSSMGGPDTTAQILAIQRNQIIYWQQMAASAQANGLKATKAVKDSLGALVRYYKSKFIEIAYHSPVPGADSSDNGTFDYKYHFTATSTQYYSKKFLWMKYKPLLDISIDDPNATINGYRKMTVTPDPPFFNLKGQVRTDYYFATGRIVPSTGIELSVGRFDFSGRYYYSYRFQQFKPVVSLTYNFFKLNN